MKNREWTLKRILTGAGIGLFSLAFVSSSHAASTWVGLGEDDNWGTSLNWDAAPTFPAALTFAGSTRLTPVNELSDVTVTNITFAAGAGAFTLGGNAITLGGNIAIAIGGSATNDQTVNLPLTLNASRILTSAPVGGNYAANKGILVINGVISGPYGLTSTGANYVQLNATNTYTGDTVMASDSFSIGNANAFGFGKVIVGASSGLGQLWIQTAGNKTITNNVEVRTGRFITASYAIAGKPAGNLTLSGNVFLNQGVGGKDFWCQTPLTLSGTVSGGGMNGLRMAAGTIILQGANTFTNHLISNYAPNTPTFNINSDAAMGHTNNGVRALVGNLTFQTAAGTSIDLAPSRTFVISADKAVTFDVPANSLLAVPGLISGGTASSNTLSKTGAGTLVLTGANTYNGSTTLNGGVLNISDNTALGAATGALNFSGSATLQTAVSNLTLNANRTVTLTNAGTYVATFDVPTNSTLAVAGVFKGNVTTNSALTKTGPGTLVLTGGSAGNPLGGMNVLGGTLSIQSGTWYTAPAQTADGTVFNVLGGATYEQTGGTNMLPIYSCISQQNTGGAYTNLTSTGNLSGGLLSGMELMVGRRNSAVMTISGTGLLDLYALKLGELAGYTTTCNLDGGVVACTYIATRDTSALATSILNFNGGTLRAKGVSGSLIGGTGSGSVSYLTKVNVKSGGAIIDSQNLAVTIAQVLGHDPDLGAAPDGGLTKRGTGSLTLTTNNTYTGVTSIEAGALKLGVANALSAAGAVLVDSNAVFDVNGKAQTLAGLGGSGLVTNNSLLTVTQGVAPGGTNAVGTLTLAATPAALGGVFLVDVAANGTCDRLNVQGNLNLSSLDLAVTDTAALNKDQQYVIASYTGTLTGPFNSAPLPPRWNVKYNIADSQVYLSYDFGTLILVR